MRSDPRDHLAFLSSSEQSKGLTGGGRASHPLASSLTAPGPSGPRVSRTGTSTLSSSHGCLSPTQKAFPLLHWADSAAQLARVTLPGSPPGSLSLQMPLLYVRAAPHASSCLRGGLQPAMPLLTQLLERRAGNYPSGCSAHPSKGHSACFSR